MSSHIHPYCGLTVLNMDGRSHEIKKPRTKPQEKTLRSFALALIEAAAHPLPVIRGARLEEMLPAALRARCTTLYASMACCPTRACMNQLRYCSGCFSNKESSYKGYLSMYIYTHICMSLCIYMYFAIQPYVCLYINIYMYINMYR